MKKVVAGLCRGRHEIKEVEDKYIFDEITDVTDIYNISHRALKFVMDEFRNEKLMYRTIDIDDDGSDIISGKKIRGHMNLYVTGLSLALVEVIKACHEVDIMLTLWHYDMSSEEYFPQEVY